MNHSKSRVINLINKTLIMSLIFLCLHSIVYSQSNNLNKLVQTLKDKNPRVRQGAAQELGEIADKRVIKLLIMSLKDEDNGVRIEAAEALVKILPKLKDTSAVEPLIAALTDEDHWVRKSAAEALGIIGDIRAISHLITSLKDWELVAEEALKALVKIGVFAVDPLIATLKDVNSYSRLRAARALGMIKDKRATETLISILKDVGEESHIRASAAYALGEIKDSRAVEPLIADLMNTGRGSFDKDAAAEALGEIGAPAVEYLILAMKDEAARSHAIKALGKTKDPRAVDPLISALEDKAQGVRFRAAESLGDIMDVRAIYPLMTTLADRDRWVRTVAARSLAKIGTPAAEHLLSALKDKNSKIRIGAAEALAYMKDDRIDDFLMAKLKDNDLEIVAGAHSFFVHRGESGTETILIEALNEYGDKEMAETLANSNNKQLYQAAAAWAKRHGYQIRSIPGGRGGPRWGIR